MNALRSLIILFGALLVQPLFTPDLSAQVASFLSPDTVCSGELITLTNTTAGGSTWYWNFCSGNANQNPTGTNIGNPGNLLDIPTYLTLVKQGNDCFSFISCQGVGVVRYYHGGSFKNNPISWTNLGTLGAITFSQEGIQVKEDNGQWYGFVCSDTKLVRLNFGASLWNTPTATSLPYTGLNMLHGLVVIKEGTTWLGFATCSTGNKMVRFNFGTTLSNVPVMTDFGNLAGFNSPGALCLVQENFTWYGLLIAGGNTLARINFGNSLLNTPTGLNLGNPGGFSSAVGLTLIRDCESTVGYWVNYLTPGQLGKLVFPDGITGTVTGTLLGNIGTLDKPHSFSEIFRQNDTLYAYITNRQTGTLTRLTFPPCSNSSVPSSTLFNPPSFSYNTAGTYNIRLIVNEGLPTQSTVCKSIVVLAAPCNPVATFTAPDTVCVGEPISVTNQSTTGASYYWSFCSGNALSNPLGVNIGNPGSLLNIPGYNTLVKDLDGTCYSFVTNQGSMSVVRYNHGTSFSNNPVSWTNLGGFGMLGDTVLGIKIRYDNGQWIGFVNNNNRIVRLNFGTSLANAPAATLLGPYTMLNTAHCLDIFKEGSTWIGYITCTWGNKLVRLNFGNSLLNTPVLTDLGIPGTMNMPGSFRFIIENGIWYGLVANFGNNTMTRLTFGTSLLNDPTGVNLGVVCPSITPGGITLIRDCEGTTGFQLNYSTTSSNLIWRLSFPSGITGPVTGTSLGNIGAMSRPSMFSELFRVGDTLFLYATNRQNFTLTRLRFLPCSNASVPSSAQYNPPTFSYNQPGTYNIQLTVNEGLPTQATFCKSIVVLAAPCTATASFIVPDTVCVGEPVTATNNSSGGNSYYWNFCSGSTTATPTGQNIGNPSGNLNYPVYSAMVKDGNDCYQFITNQGSPTHITRIYHGSNFRNAPVSVTSILQTGILHQYVEAIQIKYDNGNWYGLVCNNNTILRLNFGSSLSNTSPVVTDLGPFTGIAVAHGITIVREGTTWLAFFDSHTTNKLFRLNFGTSLANTPVFTDLGNLAGFSHPTQVASVKENGVCYLLINNYNNNTLSRITFGNSYLNTPTGQNLGNCGGLDKPHGICLLNDCETSVGFYTTYRLSPLGAIGRLNFSGGVGGTVAAQSLGNLGGLDNPCSFSDLFRQNDSLFTYVMNQSNSTLTRFSFPPCSNASIPSSTLFSPPTFSYNAPGTYSVRLVVNEGQFTEASICKSIVVLVAPCSATAAFTVPDTVCVGAPITAINTSSGGSNYYWNFCSGSAGANPAGTNIGNPGNGMNQPVYTTLVQDGTDCYSFITNHGSPTHITRYYHGSSFRNNPVSTATILQTGIIHPFCEAIQIRKENGNWYGFVNNNTTILRLDFGASITNNSPTTTDIGPFPNIAVAHGLVIVKEGTTWLGFFDSSDQNKLYRLNFGASLTNMPVLTDFGNLAGFSHPNQVAAVKENGTCYLFIVNSIGNNLSRINFGTSYLNTPTGQNLGNCGAMQTPIGITVLNDCETTTGYYTEYLPSTTTTLGKLTFSGGVGGAVTAQSLGNIGTLHYPVAFSELFRQNDSLFAYVANQYSTSLTRFSFPPCNNASIPSSTLFNPPPFSYNAPGNYSVRLVVDEGQFSEGSVCHSIAVMPQPVVSLGNDISICPGTTTVLDAGGGFESYLWSTGATSRMIMVGTAGSYWARGTKYGCEDYDTVMVSLYPVTPVNLGPDPTVCDGQTVTFNAGACNGCSYIWSNLSTGQPNIGTGQTYTTGTPGIYSVEVTSASVCLSRDTIQLFTNPVPDLLISPTDQTICSGSSTSISLSSSSSFATFSWTASLASGNITGFSGGIWNSIGQILLNNVISPGSVTYSITANIGTCVSNTVVCPVIVNPAPAILNSGTTSEMCSGSFTGFIPSSNVSGTLFNWTASGNSPDLSGFGPGNGLSIVQQLFNSGFGNPEVTYTVIPTALGCAGAPGIFTMTVHPVPDVSFFPATTAACSGDPVNIQLNSQVAPASFSWTATGSSAFISNFSGGTGTSIQQSPQNSGTDPGTVTYTVTPSSNGCPGTPVSYDATINPIPVTVVSPHPATVCSGEPFQVSFSSATAGTAFSWSASASSPLVSGYASGNGSSMSQTLQNNGTTIESVTYLVTPSANGCNGGVTMMAVTVKPLPDVTFSPASQSVCTGEQAHITLASSFSGALCSWTAAGSSPSVTGFSGGTGNSISQTLYTTGTTTQTVSYSISSSLDGCTSLPMVAQVVTYPVPDLMVAPAGQSICSGQYTGLGLQSQLAGTSYQWTASGSANITGYSGGTGNSIHQLLSNSSNTQGSVIYLVTPLVAGCTGPVTSVTVFVYPHPAVSFPVCNDTITTTAAKPIPLRGGLPPGGVYSGPGVDSGTGLFNPSTAGPGLHAITYTYSNTYSCAGTSSGTIHVLTALPFTCGGTLTDVRDGHSYATFLLPNGKCWMKENLEFGFRISDLVPQTDNCTPEFYLNPNSPISNPQSYYQWDELLHYEPVAGSQGLCPPGWHVPSSAEWEELLILNTGPGQAAGPLKDLYLPNGFHAIPEGLNYLNRTWAFNAIPLTGTFYWTSTSSGSTNAIARGLNNENQSVSLYAGSRANAFSVRCIKD